MAGHSAALGFHHVSAKRTGGKKMSLEISFSFHNAETTETLSPGVLVGDTHDRCLVSAHLHKGPSQRQALTYPARTFKEMPEK